MKKVVQFDSEEEKVMVVFTVVARLVVMLECFPEEILGRLADDCIVDLNDPNSWTKNMQRLTASSSTSTKYAGATSTTCAVLTSMKIVAWPGTLTLNAGSISLMQL